MGALKVYNTIHLGLFHSLCNGQEKHFKCVNDLLSNRPDRIRLRTFPSGPPFPELGHIQFMAGSGMILHNIRPICAKTCILIKYFYKLLC